MEEFMFLGLRMTEGVSEAVFCEAFGKTMESVYGGILRKHCAEGLLRREDGRVFLTERGIDISNTVMADYLF
jgi:oxygen-independent coproporphyrinogen-3 oxidase